MASIYSCTECGANFNLHTNHLFPPDFYFEAGNKGTVSFALIDATKFKFEKEDKIRPFFETLNYWGIQRKRTKIKCHSCSSLVGYIYDDGPPLTDSPGQFHMGPSQVIPRSPRVVVRWWQWWSWYGEGGVGGGDAIVISSGAGGGVESVRMKQMEVGTVAGNAKFKQASPPPPPPLPPPLPKFWAATKPVVKTETVSVTNQEIAKFWRLKRMEEEDHLLGAIKAAARIRARKLTEDEYKRFEESLKEDNDNKADDNTISDSSRNDENGKELRVGIKDWWTNSKYAYLNQPAFDSVDTTKGRTFSAYIPNFCNFKLAPPPTASFGIF
ncbi:unnamed protein product [Camellia sinensis]